ncbi:MAG: hypothetical protein KGH75_00485 [Rhodospirillales bacterium]|nr:hypothetical protein [Rhodospirillales bacterium]
MITEIKAPDSSGMIRVPVSIPSAPYAVIAVVRVDAAQNIVSVRIPGEDFQYSPRTMRAASCFCSDAGLAGLCIHAHAAYQAVDLVVATLGLSDAQAYPPLPDAATWLVPDASEIAEMARDATIAEEGGWPV